MSTDPPITSYTSSNTNQQGNESLKKIEGHQAEQNRMFKDITLRKLGASTTVVAIEGMKGISAGLDAYADALKQTAKQTNDNIEAIRGAYGGLQKGLEFDYVPESAVSNAVKRFQTIRYAAQGIESSTMGMASTGKELVQSLTKDGRNIFYDYFDSAEEAATNVQNILGDLSTTYGEHVSKMSDKEIAKLAFYEESLGVTAHEIQDVFQKQIGFTEEISLESLDKIGMYTSNLSQQLNIPMKTLTQMTMKMIGNTEMFGDITDIEATRMSAKLTQLGYTYEDLNAVQNKFSTFSGAAAAAGTMAQLTGVQVDAMKMSYLASEGKFDELIEYQRDSLLKAGMTKEKFLSQSNSMKNAIGKAFGRSQEELAFLLSDQRKISSQAELDAMMGKEDVAEREGFEKLLENLNQTKNAYNDTEKTLGRMTTRLYTETSEAAYKASQNFSKMNSGLATNTELLGTSQEKFSKMNTAYIDSVERTAKLDGSKVGLAEFTKTITSEAATLTKEAGSILLEAENIQKKYQQVSEQTKGMASEVATASSAVSELSATPTPGEAGSSELSAQFNQKIADLNTTISKINTENQSVDFSTMPAGTIQVIVDGNAIASELNFMQSKS